MAGLDPTKTIDGTWGTVYHNGVWLTSVKKVEAKVEVGKEEIKTAGTRWVGYKTTSLTGTGSIGMYKVSSEWIRAIGRISDDKTAPFVTELIVKLDDPGVDGTERVRLKGVQFDTIPLANYEVGAMVEDELNFTFTGYELLDALV